LATEIRDLAEIRTGSREYTPLLYDCRSNTITEWAQWLEKNYYPLAKNRNEHPPYYLLIIGGPHKIPFGFQRYLHTVAAVGRICFDTNHGYRAYLNKIIDHARKTRTKTSKSDLTIFAPNHDNTTAKTVQQFAEPIHVWADTKKDHFAAHDIIDRTPNEKRATKKTFRATLNSSSGVLFTIGHGYLDDTGKHELRNGAVCCPEVNIARLLDVDRDVFTSDDINHENACLKNGIMYQYGCFAYGTPDISTIEHWLHNKTRRYWDKEFISALPQKMLAHPDGPVGYIGHFDAAFVFFKEDTTQPFANQLSPVEWTLDSLLTENRTLGYAMRGARNLHMNLNNLVVHNVDLQQQEARAGILAMVGNMGWEKRMEFAKNLIRLNDVSNFMVLGDPAVRL
jgi:hypothetical protein